MTVTPDSAWGPSPLSVLYREWVREANHVPRADPELLALREYCRELLHDLGRTNGPLPDLGIRERFYPLLERSSPDQRGHRVVYSEDGLNYCCVRCGEARR